jgi:L-rhamnose isomerase
MSTAAPTTNESIEQAHRLACERYSAAGVDVERALNVLSTIAVSVHCWQGDDVGGFEASGEQLGGGLAVTGNYAGKARTPEELRSDLNEIYSLVPGNHRLNLHASYGDFGDQKVDRDEVEPHHFKGWIDWAKESGVGLDFNPTCFSHPKAADGFTLAHADPAIRNFWIVHCARCRRIGAAMGQALGSPCITNVWIPDGYKDTPADRLGPRQRLIDALDAVFQETISEEYNLDAVESKLFGIGAESYTVGSSEFYLGYAATRRKVLCLDAGHFHPTETIADKISSVLLYVPELLLHVSRGVRWDSDHVVTLTDDLQAIAREVVASGSLDRIHIGLDFFDASINRLAAWVIGTRNMLRALLIALLEPPGIRTAEIDGDFTARLALQEEAKSLPFGAVWDFYCLQKDAPVGENWLAEVRRYERDVLSSRD